MRQPLQIDAVLIDQRFIEIVGGLDVALDVGRQSACGVERSARRGAHHEEGHRDDDEKRGQRAKEAFKGVADHLVR